jgi:two-component system, sensor histidine kinase YesM
MNMGGIGNKIVGRIFKQGTTFKLKFKLSLAFSLFISMLILLIGLTVNNVLQNKMEESEENYIKMNMLQLNNTIDYFYQVYMGKSDMLFGNSELISLIKSHSENIADTIDTQQKILKFLYQLQMNLKYPELKSSYYFGGDLSVKLYVRNHALLSYASDISSYDEIKDQKWCQRLFTEKNMFSWESNLDANNTAQNSIGYISFSRRLLDLETVKDIAVLRVSIPVSRIKNILKNNIQNHIQSFFYVDERGNIIAKYGDDKYTNIDFFKKVNKQEHSDNIEDLTVYGKKVKIGSVVSELTGWKLIYITPIVYITEKTRFITTFITVMIIVSVLVSIFIATVISTFITKRVKILEKKTKRIISGDFSVDVVISGNDEITELDRCFNKMVEKINDLIYNEYKSKIIVNQTKFEMLQEQINPHLLYNTLSMICYISKKNNQADALNISQNLINFYKGVLSKGKVITPISSELDMIRYYIEITRFVYNLDLDVLIDVEEKIRSCYSIKLFLQPIVENAIVHGIRPNRTGKLEISCKLVDECLKFTVSDNGIGIKIDSLEQIHSTLYDFGTNKGYGIKNVVRRIKLFFGDDYGVIINSQIGVGTVVEITIPALDEVEMKEWLDNRYLHETI